MDNRAIDDYVAEVLQHLEAEGNLRERIRADLTQHIKEAGLDKGIDEVLRTMGTPEQFSRDFMHSLPYKKVKDYYEYRSSREFLGLPLVHIKFRRSKKRKLGLAKGIIAIGDISVGAIAIGALAAGGLSVGALSLGLLALGATALGAGAIGGVAIGILALGGVAIGLGALGGLAIGEIAIGGYAWGTVAIGVEAVGEYALSGNGEGVVTGISSLDVGKEEVEELIKQAHPNLPGGITKLFTFLFQ